MVHYFTPYSSSRDLGQAYNACFQLVRDPEDWVCLMDGDIQFLNSDYGHQIEEVISRYPETGLFTCLTNRVGTKVQCLNGFPSEDTNILNHHRIAEQLSQTKRTEVEEHQQAISGFLMLIQKKVWDRIGGAPEGIGILTIDNRISKKILEHGLKIRIMQGLYVFHFYRLHKEIDDRSHIIVAGQSPYQVRRKRINYY